MNLNKFKENKKLVVVSAVILILVVLGAGYFIIASKSKPADFSNPNGEASLPAVQTITAKDLGLVVTVRPDNLAVKFKINNAIDIKHVDYQITYDHLVDGQTVHDGFTGEMNIAIDGITSTDERPFGTCSSGVCRYDKEVANVKLLMKVEKKVGKIYSLEQDIPLNP